jgi:phospholipase C
MKSLAVILAAALCVSNQTPMELDRALLYAERPTPKKVSYSPEQIVASKKINHLIVIYMENWSFDGLFGKFPGANGINNARRENYEQVDPTGKPYPKLPTCYDASEQVQFPQDWISYEEIPINLPNAPFDLQPYLPMDRATGDAIHLFHNEILQINGGKMSGFAAYSNAGGFTMSYYDITSTRLGALAKQFTLCDNFFHSCYGGSMCGALWVFTGQMPTWPNPPPELTAVVLPSGALQREGAASAEGYAINDSQPFFAPYRNGIPDASRVPPQNYKTIGDYLSAKEVRWKWYAEGWNNAVSGNPDPTFPFHHQAPVYFSQFAPGTDMRKNHLFDLEDFHADLKDNQVPAVSFIRSLDYNSGHPGVGSLLDSLNWCSDLIEKIQNSPTWKDCAIIVTYDENGGRWDHVTPPVVDRFGPGTRVPAIIISPFAKKGFIDSTTYETVSILKFIEDRWEIQPMATRDAAANNLLNAFDFNQ